MESTVCYRGQSRYIWKPIPGIFRPGFMKNAEEASIRELIADTPSHFENDTTMFEKLVRAQHYQLPTRLLDVSMNPLVALYFACNEDPDKDGKVFSFSISKEDRILQFDSDKVSLISNLSRLGFQERVQIEHLINTASQEKHGAIDTQRFKTWFNSRPPVKRLVQFVRVEKPYFLNEIDPRDLKKYFFVWPKRSHPRLIAQSGAFLAAGLLTFAQFQRSNAVRTTQYYIPGRYKKQLLKELDTFNINGRSLFPEIENVSNYIKRRYSF